MKIIVIGAVAAGTSAAAKARRNNEDADITLYDRDQFISYSGCGMPYFLAGEMTSFSQIIPRDPQFFKEKYEVDVCIRHEVTQIFPDENKITVRRMEDHTVFDDYYDYLVLATGAAAVKLPLEGADAANVFTLRNPGDTKQIESYMQQHPVQHATIIGSGFIGLEMAESFSRKGLNVTILEKMPHLNPSLDPDMSRYVEQYLDTKNIQWVTGAEVTKLTGNAKVDTVHMKHHEPVHTELVLTAVGIRPEISLARKAGIELGTTGGIKTDTYMRTSISNIFACGDCCETFSFIDGQPLYRPLGSTANKTGRVAGDVITGGSLQFKGISGTGIFRLFDLTVAQTGMTENEAKAKGYEPVSIHNTKPDRPAYMGGREMIIKAVADKGTGRLLGAQIIGYDGVDKRIDVLSTALYYKASAADLADLDLAYAPPYSTTRDPVIYTGMIMDNALNRGRSLIKSDELPSARDIVIIDTRTAEQYDKGHVEHAVNIPHANIRAQLAHLPKNKTYVTYCNKGTTGNAVQNILLSRGYRAHNLSGGHKHYCCQNKIK